MRIANFSSLFRFQFVFLITALIIISLIVGNAYGKDNTMWQEKDLGTQITVVNIQSASFGKDESGRDVVFAQIYGKPGQLAIVNIDTQKVSKVLEIPGANGAYANVFASNGNVYLGSNPNGHLYSYKPGEDAISDLGKPFPETTFIWDMIEGKDGKLYGGTYPQGKVFAYNMKTGEYKGFGSMVEGEDYVRSIVFDPESGHVFTGIGSHAALIRLNPLTGEKTDILPQEYKDCHFVYTLDLVDGKIICKMDPKNIGLVLDLKTNSLDSILPEYHSNHVSQKSPIGNVCYYTASGMIMEYDIIRKSHRSTEINMKGNARVFSYRMEKDRSPTLLAMSANSRILHYDIKKNKKRLEWVDLPKQPVIIQSIFKGPDGKIYSSGYLSGGTAIYDPKTGESKEYRGVGQAEGITSIGTRLYFGVYPRARIYEYDTSKDWDTNKGNPREIFRLEQHDQDRPFAMLGLEKENKLIIGTVPAYGILGGALCIHDFKSKQPVVMKNIIPNQSITAITYLNGKVYGGTSISGGLGVKPKENEAKLFIWDLAKGEKTYETVPVPGKIAITCLKTSPDGKIWGLAEGVLFIFDPKKRKTVYSEEKFIVNYSGASHVWRGAIMEYGEDGYFYGTYDKKFFRINIQSRDMEILQERDVHLLVRDEEGFFYYAKGEKLFQIKPTKE